MVFPGGPGWALVLQLRWQDYPADSLSNHWAFAYMDWPRFAS